MSSIAIEQEIANLEKKLKEELLPNLHTVEQAKTEKQREKILLENKIGNIRVELKDLEQAVREARYNVKDMELFIKKRTRDFWSAKNSGV